MPEFTPATAVRPVSSLNESLRDARVTELSATSVQGYNARRPRNFMLNDDSRQNIPSKTYFINLGLFFNIFIDCNKMLCPHSKILASKHIEVVYCAICRFTLPCSEYCNRNYFTSTYQDNPNTGMDHPLPGKRREERRRRPSACSQYFSTADPDRHRAGQARRTDAAQVKGG